MQTATNIALNTVGSGLIALGITTIASSFWHGIILIILGIAAFGVYEFTPVKPQ